MLSNLGLALQARFERTGDLADLDAAITARPAGGDATPAGHPDRASDAVQPRRRPDSPVRADRETGPTWTTRSTLPAGGGGHPARPPRPRRAAVQPRRRPARRFERTGDLADLDAAITAGRQAVAASPADHPDRAG